MSGFLCLLCFSTSVLAFRQHSLLMLSFLDVTDGVMETTMSDETMLYEILGAVEHFATQIKY